MGSLPYIGSNLVTCHTCSGMTQSILHILFFKWHKGYIVHPPNGSILILDVTTIWLACKNIVETYISDENVQLVFFPIGTWYQQGM